MTAEIDPERILASSVSTVDRAHARTTLRAPIDSSYGQRFAAGMFTRGHKRKESDLRDVSLGEGAPSCDTGRADSLGNARRIQSSSARRPYELGASSPIR